MSFNLLLGDFCPSFRENFHFLFSKTADIIKQCCNASVSTLTLNETSNLNPHEEVLFLLGCPILSLEDLLAQRVLRFVSLALGTMYKIRTERRLELGAPWLMKNFFFFEIIFCYLYS